MEVPGARRKETKPRRSRQSDISCAQCEESGSISLSSGFCQTCNDFLCSACIKQHKKFRGTRNHELLEGDDMPHKKPTPTDVEWCTVHPERPIEMYCLDEGSTGCTLCFSTGHRTCRNVDMISNLSKSMEFSEELAEIRGASNKQKILLNQFRKTVTILRSINDSSHSKCLEDYQSFQGDMVSMLHKVGEAVSKRAESVQKQNSERLDKLMDTIARYDKPVDSCLQNTDEGLLGERERVWLFIAVKRNKTQIYEFVQSLEQLGRDLHINQLNLSCDPSFKERFCDGIVKLEETTLLASKCQDFFEKYNHVTTNTATPNSTKFQKPLEDKRLYANTITSHAPKLQASKKENNSVRMRAPIDCVATSLINIKSFDDKNECCVTGLVEICLSRLILADLGNSSLKLVDVDAREVIKRQRLKHAPLDVTLLPDSRVAVTVPDGKEIRIYETDQLNMCDKFGVGGECHGLHCTGDNIIVTFLKPVKVEIIDFAGRVLQSIKQSDSTGHVLFTCPQDIMFNVDNKLIYVSDYKKNSITCMNMTGSVRWVYKDRDLKGPTGVMLGDDRCIYTISKNSHTIHVVSPEGVQLAIIPESKTGVKYALAACKSSFEQVIFVSNDDRKGDKNLIRRLVLQ